MPFKSSAQRRWAHTKEGTKALGGKAAVKEWDEATKGKKLPEKVGKSELDKSLKGTNLSTNSFNTIGTQSMPNKFNMTKAPKAPKNISLAGKQSVTSKTPKPKKGPDPFTFPSKFFEKSEFEPKHENLKKLWDFINKRHKS